MTDIPENKIQAVRAQVHEAHKQAMAEAKAKVEIVLPVEKASPFEEREKSEKKREGC